jgi:outer membrane protein assembly factor BamB
VGGALAGAGTVPARAQDWTTAAYDAQRSSWVRADAKISPGNLRKPGFQLLWKVKADAAATGPQAVAAPVLIDLVIGYRGFRALGFIGAGADTVLAVDTDLGRPEWQRGLTGSPPSGAASPACGAALTPTVARATNAALPGAAGYGGGGGGAAARSAVGEPGQGAVTVAAAAGRRNEAGLTPPPPPVVPPAPPTPPRPRASPRPFPVLYVLALDGALRTLSVMDGADVEPPVPFVPPHADARGLIVVDDVAYVATSSRCGTAPAAVWALDLGTKHVSTWRARGGDIAGSVGPAIGPDGTVDVTTTGGELVALEARTLTPQRAYRSGGPGFTSSPVIFEHRGRMLIAAATRDGRIHLLDGSRLASVRPPALPAAGVVAAALASWADSGGTRWLLAAGRGGLVTWKVVDQNGAPVFQPGWTWRDISAPLPPLVINGVVFAVASGPARLSVLYAFDGATGRELWNSGTAIASIAQGGLSGESGQVYVRTNDGTVYAFGFPMEH